MKNLRQIERIVKGFANHRRIEILILLNKKPELNILDIAEELNINFKTASAHVMRLTIAGLIMKRNEGHCVCHAVTSLGKIILKFLRTLE